MKTTIDIADPLFDEAKRVALRDGETFRSLVEQGLRAVLSERALAKKPFKLKDCSFMGTGLQPEFEGRWDRLVEASYETDADPNR